MMQPSSYDMNDYIDDVMQDPYQDIVDSGDEELMAKYDILPFEPTEDDFIDEDELADMRIEEKREERRKRNGFRNGKTNVRRISKGTGRKNDRRNENESRRRILRRGKMAVQLENKSFINDDIEADEILEKISEIQADMKHIEEVAEKRIERIENWKNEELMIKQNRIDKYNQQLQLYFDRWREENPGKKTLSLAYGKIQSRKQRNKWIYPEDDELIKNVKEVMPDLIEVKEKVNKNELKKKLKVVNGNVVIEETGEVLGCIKVEEQGEKVIIKAV